MYKYSRGAERQTWAWGQLKYWATLYVNSTLQATNPGFSLNYPIACTNFGWMSPIFIQFSKKLPNYPTKSHMKFQSHQISFDGGSLPIKGFSLTRRGFTLFMLVSPYLLVIQWCAIAKICAKALFLRVGNIFKGSKTFTFWDILKKKQIFIYFFYNQSKALENRKHIKHQNTSIWKLKSAKVSKLPASLTFRNIWLYNI